MKALRPWQVAFIHQAFSDDRLDAKEIEEIVQKVDDFLWETEWLRKAREDRVARAAGLLPCSHAVTTRSGSEVRCSDCGEIL